MKKNKFLLIFLLLSCCAMRAQTTILPHEMNEEEAMLYFLRINNVDPDEIIFKRGNIDNNYTKQPATFTRAYLEKVNSYDYNLSKNDEFKCYELFKTAREKLLAKSKQIDFDKKYILITPVVLREYNFNLQAFPFEFNIANKFLFTKPEIYLCEMTNIGDFDHTSTNSLLLRIPPSEASYFVDSRKNQKTGSVDRKVFLKITYSILNQKNPNCSKYFMVDFNTGLIGVAYSIEAWYDPYCNNKIIGEVKKVKSTPVVAPKSVKPISTQNLPNCGMVTDIDENSYHTVTIGNQCWLTENLKASHYNDGTSIANITTNPEWNTATYGGFCFYNNNASYNATYGKLYNWYAVGTGKLCPLGWHVPTDVELRTLTTFLGGAWEAGGRMKSQSLWEPPNGGATNSSGFNAIPTGERSYTGFSNTSYYPIGYGTCFWTSTPYDNLAFFRKLNYFDGSFLREKVSKNNGYCVRCMQSNDNGKVQSQIDEGTKTSTLAGTWVGTYDCPPGIAGLKFIFTSETDVIFKFYPIRENPNIPPGSLKMKVEKSYNNKYNFKFISWINQPDNYYMIDFTATVNFNENTIKATLCGKPLVLVRE